MAELPPPLPASSPAMEKPGIGVCLSLMLPGLGIYVAGRKLEGLAWTLGTVTLIMFALWTLSVRDGTGAFLGAITCLGSFGFWFWMLRCSYAAVPCLSGARWARAAAAAIIYFVSVFFAGREIVRPFSVPTNGMAPTIQGSKNVADESEKLPDRILVQGCAYWFQKPQHGDILVFRTTGISAMNPSQKDQYYVKRLVGLPGDRISIRKGRLLHSGVPVEKPETLKQLSFPDSPMMGQQFLAREDEEFAVPAGHYFVIGDNVANSYDSRFFGVVPARNIFGRATKIYWPPDRAGSIR